MWKLILISLLGASYAVYPYSVNVLYDPKAYDELYDSTQGAVVENWWFSEDVRLVTVTVPSQVHQSSPSSFYQENIVVKIRKNEDGILTEIASGEFRGFASYGSEINIPVYDVKDGVSYPVVEDYGYPPYTTTYVVEISLNVPGYYPYHKTRRLDDIPAFDQRSDPAGIVIGIDYSFLNFQ